jgi:hypothetical protein
VDAASAKWSRETVQNNFKNVITGKNSIEWNINKPGIKTLTITYQDIKTVLASCTNKIQNKVDKIKPPVGKLSLPD